jgi:hypothetical protein
MPAAWPWIPVVAAFAGATVATFLAWLYGHVKARKERARKATGFLRGIDAEIDYSVDHARKYVKGDEKNGKRIRVLAPPYRLLTRFAVEGSTWLAGEGDCACYCKSACPWFDSAPGHHPFQLVTFHVPDGCDLSVDLRTS